MTLQEEVMTAKRKRHKPEFKAQVALEAYNGDKTINQPASEHEVAVVQISQWKRQLLQRVPEVFGRTRPEVDPEALTAPLHQEIGRLKMELEWLKKNLAMSIDDRRKCIEPSHPEMSIQCQCELIELNGSSWYYQTTPAPLCQDSCPVH